MHERIITPMTRARTPLSSRAVRGLVWVAWGACLLLILSALIIWFLDGGNLLQHLSSLLISIAFACFGTVGALIASQRPKNTIGWIFCIVGIGTGMTDFSGAYASFGTTHGHVLLPGSGIVNWLGDTIWPFNWGLMLVFLPLLFPNGHILTRRWRIVSWLAAMMILLSVLTSQLAHFGPASTASSWSDLGSIISLLALPLAIAALVSLVLRFRRAGERERQQIKWLTYGTAMMATLIVGGVLLLPDPNGPDQPHADLPAALGSAGARLSDADLRLPVRLPGNYQGFAGAHCHLDAGRGGAFPTSAPGHPTHHRPPFLSPQIQRGAGIDQLQRDLAQRA